MQNADLAEQTQWLADLLSKQQAMFGRFGAFGGTVPGGKASPGGMTQLMAPWLEAVKSFLRLQSSNEKASHPRSLSVTHLAYQWIGFFYIPNFFILRFCAY